jgi:hypothetical protein
VLLVDVNLCKLGVRCEVRYKITPTQPLSTIPAEGAELFGKTMRATVASQTDALTRKSPICSNYIFNGQNALPR